MRRLLLFAALLSLVGLSTAFAASFNVQAEDVASFPTDVSISVPTTQPPAPVPFPSILYVRNGSNAPIGTLDLQAPAKNDSVTKRALLLSTETVGTQTTATKYITWKSPPAPPSGYLLSGSVTLYFEQSGGGANRSTAALFSCPAAASPSTTTSPTDACTIVATGTAAAVSGGGQGFIERTVSFGAIAPTTIPPGHELRLKIVNRSQDPPVVLSTADVDVQWGFLPARQSRLEITP